MNLKGTASYLKPGPVQLIMLLALLQLIITLFTDGYALSFDEAMWHYIGRNWFRHAMVPYSGGVDNKSPLIFAVFGVSDTLFGVNYWFVRVLATMCQSVGIYYVYKIARYVAGDRAGILAISIYGLSLLWHGTGGKYVAFTETYEVMFIILSFYKYITAQTKKDFFFSGLLAGFGLGFRLSAVLAIVAIAISLLNKSRNSMLAFFIGVLSSIALLVAVCSFAGINVHDLFNYGLTDNFSSGSATDHSLSWKLANFSDKFLHSGMVLFYPFVLAYLFIKRAIDVFILWLGFAFAGINIVGIYDVVHLKELLPALSLISALVIVYLIDNYRLPIKWVMLIIWICFFPKTTEPLVNIRNLLSGRVDPPVKFGDKPNEGSRKKLGQWVKANTVETDKVLVAGFGAQVQAYSERVSPTIYFNATQTPIAKQRFFHDLNANKPAMILVPLFAEYTQLVSLDMRQFLDVLIQKDYYLYSNQYNYNIYRLKAAVTVNIIKPGQPINF